MSENRIVVSKDILNAIQERVAYVMEDQPTPAVIDGIVELEGVVTRRVDVVEFMRALAFCMSSGLPIVQQEPCLDITFSNVTMPKGQSSLIGVRVSVIGFDHISRYYAVGALEQLPMTAVRVIRKTRARGYPQLDVPDYDIRLNLRIEESCAMSAFEPKTLRTVPKTFRLKSRVSFMSRDGMFRYDFTKVHMSDGSSQHVSNSGLTQSTERYEIEVELMQPSVLQSAKSLLKKVKSLSSESIAQSLLSHMGMLLSVMSDSPCLMSRSETQDVIKSYESITGTAKFGGSQPVTLERKHLLPVELLPPNARSIQSGYSVTLKYDGERHLLLVAPNTGKLYLLSRSRFVTSAKSLGCAVPEWAGTLIDGEFMSQDRVFAAFDLYYEKGSDAVKDHGLLDRLQKLDACVSALRGNCTSIELITKQFKTGEGPAMFSACKELLESTKHGDVPFEIDGLVFTPTGSLREDAKTFKWKPPETNTVDFLATLKMQTKTKTTLQLYCGYKQTKHASLTPIDYLRDGGKAARATLSQSRYVARKFPHHGTTEVQHTANDRLARCENGDVIDDKSIIECRFDAAFEKWIPVKVRWDKVQEMYGSKRITANNCDTAMSVWRTITVPVDTDVLSGEVVIDEKYTENDADLYYNREFDITASENMRRFHNWVVKLCLLLGWAVDDTGGSASVLDIGCGKGGDIPKYIMLGVRRVLGIDLSVSNIRDPEDGAYARLEQLTDGSSPGPECVFLSMDASKPFVSAEDAKEACVTEEDRLASEVLWGTSEAAQEKFVGFAVREPFDIVTLMFDVHYMFDRRESLDTLLSNISGMIRSGGLVVGACLDGEMVNRSFEETGEDVLVGKSPSGQIVFRLEKKYASRDTPYGNMLGVYVESINQVIDEPLVDSEELKARFEDHGFELVRTDGFRNVFSAALEDIEQFTQFVPRERMTSDKVRRTIQSVKDMSDAERQYSFLHMYFIFRKK